MKLLTAIIDLDPDLETIVKQCCRWVIEREQSQEAWGQGWERVGAINPAYAQLVEELAESLRQTEADKKDLQELYGEDC